MTSGGFLMPLTEIAVDDGPHNMDGLLLHAWDGSERVEAFISRRVVDVLLSDITQSGEVLDVSGLVREPLPPSFKRM
jgi:hypothetical protein